MAFTTEAARKTKPDPKIAKTLTELSSQAAVKRAAKHMLDVGGRIIGVVLNDIDTTAKGYRSYYGAYYHYYQSEAEREADQDDETPAEKKTRRRRPDKAKDKDRSREQGE